jgi:uncharacterized membrane protein HdeD (DUF308 family)
MSNDPAPRPWQFGPRIEEDLRRLKDSWLWFVILGVALILLGMAALSYSVLFTIASVEVFGFFLIIGAVILIGASFFTGSWGGFFLTLLTGALQLIAGVICVRHPLEAAVVSTMLLAVVFIVGGLFRIVFALSERFRSWPWVLLNGVVTLMLGLMIWAQLPFSGLWVIGTFLGIDLIFNGASFLALGLGVRRLQV